MQSFIRTVLSRRYTPIFLTSRKLFVTLVVAVNILNARATTQSYKTCGSSLTTSCKDMSDPTSEDSYTTGSSSVAFVTTPDNKLAKKLAQGLVEKKLAACVNIIPHIQSIYMWEGKVNEDNEYLMMIKTRTSRMDEVIKFVRENHSYSVAEVITLPIENGNAPYLSWIAQTVPDKK
ncbi:PREDICTED: protein CutA homolog [Bactrocera latifrons]|uniref:Protein CutA n=1 Tax=Bactrocera latifrons TaxID=174628 RepID=A0A0K8VKU0_BACLA|nr:PREDICTED: protein CutA homolog [Bactrocera latifrons]